MKAAAWLAMLAVLVGATVRPLTPAQRAVRVRQASRTARPDTDLSAAPGHRALWATGGAVDAMVRADDRALDIVSRALDLPVFPFERLPAAVSPDVRLARRAQRMDLIAIVTVTDLVTGPWRAAGKPAVSPSTPPPAFETRSVEARVETVIKDQSRFRVSPGQMVTFPYEGGGTVRMGGTAVTTRLDDERVPVRGRRYLWFFAGTETELFGGAAANAIDLSGVRLQPLSRTADDLALGSLSVETGLAIVRHASVFPAVFRQPRAKRIDRVAVRRRSAVGPGVITAYVP